jgi:hypothetical protein
MRTLNNKGKDILLQEFNELVKKGKNKIILIRALNCNNKTCNVCKKKIETEMIIRRYNAYYHISCMLESLEKRKKLNQVLYANSLEKYNLFSNEKYNLFSNEKYNLFSNEKKTYANRIKKIEQDLKILLKYKNYGVMERL